MNKLYKYKRYFILIVFMILTFLFPKNVCIAEEYPNEYTVGGNTYKYTTEDDGSDGPDVSGLKFDLTYYGGLPLGSGYDVSKMTKNSEFGWMEYKEGDVSYVVVAAATHEMLNNNHGRTGEYWFYGAKFEHIHYFKYPQKFKFRFEDTSVSSETFNAIVLDSGDVMMFPQHEKYNRAPNVNALDIYFGPSGETDGDPKGISRKIVTVSLDGTFPNSTAQKASNSNNAGVLKNALVSAISGLGDILQKIMDQVSTGKECKFLSYKEKEITQGYKETKVKNVKDKKSKSETVQIPIDSKFNEVLNGGEELIKPVFVPKTIENKKGKIVNAFSKNTEIPVVQTDCFTLINGAHPIYEVNYFKEETEDFENKEKWEKVKAFILTYSKIFAYFGVVLLLTMLIYNGIKYILNVLNGNPGNATTAKEVINSFIRSFILILGIYFFIAIMLFLSNKMVELIVGDYNSTFYFKVEVEDTYSFYTNITGYYKYMSLIEDSSGKIANALGYLAVVIINFLFFLIMLLRIVIISILIIIVPIPIINYMRGEKAKGGNKISNLFYFSNWLSFFIRWTYIPLIIALYLKYIFFAIIGK